MSKRIDVVLNSQYKELMDKYEKLRIEFRRMEKEFNKLQVEHSRVLFDMDAVIEHEVEVKCKKLTAKLEKENEKLKEELKETEDTLFHRDGVLSIMYDLVRSGRDEYDIVTMISSVIDDECGNYDELNEMQKEDIKRFWNRDF